MGIDPYVFMDVDDEDYFIKVACLRKARDLQHEQYELQAKMIAHELAQILGYL